MKTFQVDGFDSKNTCYRKEIKALNFTSAIKKMLKVKNDFKVIVYGGLEEGVEIENNEVTSATNSFGFHLSKKDYFDMKYKSI